MRSLAITLLILSVTAANADDQTSNDALFQHLDRVGNFIAQASSIVRNKGKADLEKLGPIKSRKVEPTEAPNAPPGEKWTHLTFLYPGLTIGGDVGPDGSFYPTYMEVSDSRWQMPLGLKVGSSLAELKTALGDADSTPNSEISYRDETETVAFHIVNKKISSIDFDIYLD
jgi:hypothetical protein